MDKFGLLLVIIGVVSAGLTFTSYEFEFLDFIQEYPDFQAWAVRMGLVAVGLLLFIVGSKGRKTGNISSQYR